MIPLKNINGPIQIKLLPANNVLDEVIVNKLSPLDYIRKALDHLNENFPQDAYQTIAYYREKFIENDKIIGKKEGVFKTFYPSSGDTLKNQHQLLLYKPAENTQKFQFMRKQIDKKIEKERQKSIKKGEEVEDDFDLERDMNMGGPETIINLADLRNDTKGNFLNPKHFKKYDYSFGEETSLNGEALVTINYKAKRKIEYVKDEGKIIISKDNYAIVLIQGKGKLSIPMMAKPILFLLGLSISNPNFSNMVSYQKYKGKWHPKLFRWDANISLKKRHMFKSNEYSKINVGQVFFINKIDSIAKPIPKEKLFDADNEMEDQIYNDNLADWNQLNIIKD